MRVLVNTPSIDILRTRIFISRAYRLFALSDVAKEWNMSRTSLYRYDSHAYREYSREVVKRGKRPQDEEYEVVKIFKDAGYTSLKIARLIGLPLARVNDIYKKVALLQTDLYNGRITR